MKKFTSYHFSLFLKCWLISLAYQPILKGQVFAEEGLLIEQSKLYDKFVAESQFNDFQQQLIEKKSNYSFVDDWETSPVITKTELEELIAHNISSSSFSTNEWTPEESFETALNPSENSEEWYSPSSSFESSNIHLDDNQNDYQNQTANLYYYDPYYKESLEYAPEGAYQIEKLPSATVHSEHTINKPIEISQIAEPDESFYTPENLYKIETVHAPESSQPLSIQSKQETVHSSERFRFPEQKSRVQEQRESVQITQETISPLDDDLTHVKNHTKVIKRPASGQQIGCQFAEDEMSKRPSVAPVVGFASPAGNTLREEEPQTVTVFESQALLPSETDAVIKQNASSTHPLFPRKSKSLYSISESVQTASSETNESFVESALNSEQSKKRSDEIAQISDYEKESQSPIQTMQPKGIPPQEVPTSAPRARETTETRSVQTVEESRPTLTPQATESIPQNEPLLLPTNRTVDTRQANPAIISPQSVNTPVIAPAASTARPDPIITPAPAARLPAATTPAVINHPPSPDTLAPTVNFNNVSMIEYIRFISRISDKNFIFDEEDLLFNVTIVSQEPTSIENLMAALLQELRIRDLSLLEQGNNLIIHRNPRVRSPGYIVTEGVPLGANGETQIVTYVFRLNTLDPIKATEIIRPLLSDDALVEVLRDTNNLIITDLVTNVNKIAQLIHSLDAPNGGQTIGQYAVQNTFVESLVDLTDRLLQPIAQGNPYVLVPYPASNSIFVVSNAFIVDRAMAILQNLDLHEAQTQILTLEKLKLDQAAAERRRAAAAGANGGIGGSPGVPFGPNGAATSGGIGTEGQSPFGPGGIRDDLQPGGISANPRWLPDLPPGHIERTLFFIHKLKYRRGDQIEIALRKIADSLQFTGTSNEDLVSAINSTQWIESSNSLIFTGTAPALDKVRELIDEIDLPLRQVFIEMLVLDTTINDSLTYGVDWGARFGGPDAVGAEGFFEDTSLITGLDGAIPNATAFSSAGLARATGFSLGVIGRHITHGGLSFNSIGALVKAVHEDTKTNIIMNPKIITEDNNTAEIFVGATTRYKTQSISNDLGTILTNNFQFLDVGTTLRVTPLIGNNNVITLDIIQEITSDAGTAIPQNASVVDVSLIPVVNKNKTVTKAHVPNGYFVVISGMISDNRSRTKAQIPCLGCIPLIGAIGKQTGNRDDKRNLMIFIRPLIVDTDEELEYLTKRQQDIFREKSKLRRSWNFEIDEALDFAGIRPSDPDEIGCTIK